MTETSTIISDIVVSLTFIPGVFLELFSSKNCIFKITRGSILGGKGRPVMMTPRPKLSAKSRPSLAWQKKEFEISTTYYHHVKKHPRTTSTLHWLYHTSWSNIRLTLSWERNNNRLYDHLTIVKSAEVECRGPVTRSGVQQPLIGTDMDNLTLWLQHRSQGAGVPWKDLRNLLPGQGWVLGPPSQDPWCWRRGRWLTNFSFTSEEHHSFHHRAAG